MKIRLFPHLRMFSRSSFAYLFRHKIQGLLMVMGITIGVAVAVAIDLANASSAKALELSTQSLVGKATHQVFAPPAGLDEAVFKDIIKSGLSLKAVPVVSGIVTSPQMGNSPMQLMGIDPFYDYAFRSYLGQTNQFFDANAFQLFTHPGAVIISRSIATQYSLKPGDSVSVDYGGETKNAYVAGVVTSNDGYQNRIFQGLIISDISTAQEILQKEGTIDRIDLILPLGNQAIEEQLSLLLPGSVKVTPIEARSAGLDQLTSAFQTNLTALSFLAMLVGMFLIYNTMTFSIVQRRSFFGIYRCLGVTRREIFYMVMAEATVIGIVGGLLGLIVGIGLGQFTIKMVSQTVNDLYFTTTINSTSISYSSLVKGFLLGLITTIMTAVPPALEAASVSPREALSRYSVEHRSKQRIWKVALAGVAAFGLAFVLLYIPTQNLILGFSIIAFITIGFAMVTPLVMVWLLNIFQPFLIKISRLSGRLAPRNLISSLSRTSVAVSALMVSIAVSIGVGLMIGSFRTTVDVWLRTSLQGDVYITAPSFISNQPTLPIDPAILPDLKTNPEVASFYQLKINTVESESGEVQIAATDNMQLPFERLYKHLDIPKSEIWQAMENGSILITESLAYRLGIPDSGGSLNLATSQGLVRFPVIGVYYDYASTSGTIQMPLDVYQRYWGDKTISAIGIHLKPGINAEIFSKNLPGILPTNQSLLIRPNKDLRQDVMVVFDRTFAITRALQILAMVVAFIGILSALGLLQFERQREMGIMRALGLTNREVWSLAMLETFLMGLVAGLMAIPTGYTLALILVDIINQRSFGWSMSLSATPMIFVQAIVIAIAAAVLAGIFPAWRMSHMQAVEAIRYE